MTTQYQENFDHTSPFSDTGAKIALAMNVALSYTVPGTASMLYRCEFTYTIGSSVWVGLNVTATGVSAGTIAASYNEEFMPQWRYVKGGDVLSFIDNLATTQMGLRLLALPNV